MPPPATTSAPTTILAQILREVYPRLGLALQMDAFRSHSDGNLFFAAGVKPLILGPGSLETAHTPDERVVFEEVYVPLPVFMRRSVLGR